MGARSSFIVIMPVYNEESTILHALDSVWRAAQNTSSQLERIIVCLNGCTDNTETLVRGWKKGPLTIIHSERGMIPAMNTLITYARKRYPSAALIKTDGDTVVDRRAFHYLFSQLEKHPKLMLTGGHPVPLMGNLSVKRRLIAKITSVRSRYPLAEVARHDVRQYHPYAATDPLPGIGHREERLKIYFHGRLWCIRRASILPLLPEDAIGEDVFLPGWIFKTFGTDAIRVDYRATVTFRANYSLRRHWKVYRRVHEDRSRVYALPGFEAYARHCPLKLDWKYIMDHVPLRDQVYFALYDGLARVEKLSFKLSRYRDSFWQYEGKEV